MRHNLKKIYKIRKAAMMFTTLVLLTKVVSSQTTFSFDIVSTLSYIQTVLSHVGPLLSAVLFIIAGIFYALGQLFPSHQKGSFHTAASDLIIGAIIVGVLSVAANGFALASTQLLSNVTASNAV